MRRSIYCNGVFVSAAIFTLLASGAGAKVVDTKAKPSAPKVPLIMKYEGKQNQRYQNKEILFVYAIDLISGKEVAFGVPPEDPKAKEYAPKTRVSEALDQCKAGDYIKVEADVQYNMHWISGIDKYKMAAGEEVPGTFVFYETYEKKDVDPHVQWVTVTKWGQALDAILPMKQAVIDPGMLDQVNKFTKGDVVTIEATPDPSGGPALLRSIDLYKPPQEAVMGKVVEADVASDQKGAAVELTTNGVAVTLPIRGRIMGKKWVPDGMLLSRARSFKAGSNVLYSVHEEDGKTYIKEIKLAPPQPAGGRPDAKK